MDDCWICKGAFRTQRENGLGILPTFKGYTVDFRLRQFRKVSLEGGPSGCCAFGPIEFIDFDSREGRQLCDEMHEAAVEILNERMAA